MENAPIMRFAAIRPSREVRDRFDGWYNEVYYPEMSKLKGVAAIERFKIINGSPGCPETMGVSYFRNLQALGDYLKDPERVVIFNDMKVTWLDKYGGEIVWDGVYRVVKSFGKEPLIVAAVDDFSSLKSTPVIQIAGVSLLPENVASYATWFETTGYGVWVPLLLKVPGVKRIDCLEFLGGASAWGTKPKQDPGYPLFVTVSRFDSLHAFEEFEKSVELAAYREGIKANFPNGLDYKWYATYQLVKSWRK